MKPYRTNLRAVPHVGGLTQAEDWINMQVQFLIDQKTAGSDKSLIGWTVLPPGAHRDKHRHANCDEFFIVIQGHGFIYTDTAASPREKARSFFRPRGHWHGFASTGTEDVALVWEWSGTGSLEAAGCEIPPEGY